MIEPDRRSYEVFQQYFNYLPMLATCRHCRKTAREMEQLTKLGIRVRLVAFPLAGPQSEAGKIMTDVLCAPNRQQAYMHAVRNEPVSASTCGPQNMLWQYALGKKLALPGSPATFSDTGDFLGGYLTPAEMLQKLQSLQAHEDPKS